MKGIDVSKYQGEIDWRLVAAAGYKFAMVRAGCGIVPDPRFGANVKAAKAAGLDVGVYWYTKAANAADMAEEMTLYLKTIAAAGVEITMPVAWDMEYERDILNISAQCRTCLAKAALEAIEGAGYYAILYSSEDFLQSQLKLDELTPYDLWVAKWSEKAPSIRYGIWQCSNKGSVPGISGPVDLDETRRDYPRILRNAKLNNL